MEVQVLSSAPMITNTMLDNDYIMHRLVVSNIPIVAGLDFGHTSSMLTVPIGGVLSSATKI